MSDLAVLPCLDCGKPPTVSDAVSGYSFSRHVSTVICCSRHHRSKSNHSLREARRQAIAYWNAHTLSLIQTRVIEAAKILCTVLDHRDFLPRDLLPLREEIIRLGEAERKLAEQTEQA